MNDIFLTVLPLLLAVSGLAAAFIISKDPKRDGISVGHFALFCPAAGLALLFGYYFVGLIPFYQARLAMASFYFLLFPCCLGALKILRSEKLAYVLVFSGLFLYNFFYTAKLLSSLLP
jgi:hypothetical protein